MRTKVTESEFKTRLDEVVEDRQKQGLPIGIDCGLIKDLISKLGVEIEPDPDENWKPEAEERYYTFLPFSDMPPYTTTWGNTVGCFSHLRSGRVARTKEQALLYKAQEEAWWKLWDKANYHSSGLSKWIPVVDPNGNIIVQELPGYVTIPVPAFFVPGDCNRAVDEVGRELIAGYMKRMSRV